MNTNNGVFRVLRVKPFLFLWLAEVFSQISMNMLNFVLIIAVFNSTHSNTAVAGIILCFTGPAILFGAIAGVYVDRWNKRNVLLWTNLIRTVLIFFLVFFNNSLPAIYLLSFAIFTVTQFFIPAETPIIPHLVKKEVLLQANALFGMAIYASIFIAYALSSPSLLILGEQKTYVFLALLFFIAAIFVILIRMQDTQVTNSEKDTEVDIHYLLAEMKKTSKLILHTKDIFHAIFLLTFFNVLILIIASIGPGYATQILNIPVERFPLLLVTPAAFGMIVGAIIVGHFFANTSRQKVANVGLILIGITAVLLPYGSKVTAKPFILWLNGFLPHYLDVTIVHFMVFLAFLLGIGGAFIFVPSNTVLQEKTSDELRGKIYGFLGAITGASSLLPIIAVGGLADIFGVAHVLTGIGIIIFIIAFIRMTFL